MIRNSNNNCAKCGEPFVSRAVFCVNCGTPVSNSSNCSKQLVDGAAVFPVCGAASSALQVSPIAAVKPKRGGRLALKGLLLAFLLALIFGALTSPSKFVAVGWGMGAAYIITSLHKWKKEGEVVRGAAVGWVVAICLLAFCLAASGILTKIGSAADSVGDRVFRNGGTLK